MSWWAVLSQRMLHCLGTRASRHDKLTSLFGHLPRRRRRRSRNQPPNGWRCAALPGQAADAQMRRGRAGAELRHKAPTGTWRRAKGAGASPQATVAAFQLAAGNVSTSALLDGTDGRPSSCIWKLSAVLDRLRSFSSVDDLPFGPLGEQIRASNGVRGRCCARSEVPPEDDFLSSGRMSLDGCSARRGSLKEVTESSVTRLASQPCADQTASW